MCGGGGGGVTTAQGNLGSARHLPYSGVLRPWVSARVRTHHSAHLRYLQIIVSIKSPERCKECLEETRTVEETK